MLNIMVFTCVFAFSFSLFRFSYTSSGVANCFNAFDFTYAQAALKAPTDNSMPYFLKKKFESITREYFTVNLKSFLLPGDKWSLVYDFREIAIEQGILVPPDIPPIDRSRPIEAGFSFTCRFDLTFTYSNSKSFIIKEGKTHGS